MRSGMLAQRQRCRGPVIRQATHGSFEGGSPANSTYVFPRSCTRTSPPRPRPTARVSISGLRTSCVPASPARGEARTVALNPIAYTENVVRSFLRYQLTAYPFADPHLHAQMRELLSLDETRQSPRLKGRTSAFRGHSAVDSSRRRHLYDGANVLRRGSREPGQRSLSLPGRSEVSPRRLLPRQSVLRTTTRDARARPRSRSGRGAIRRAQPSRVECLARSPRPRGWRRSRPCRCVPTRGG